MFISQIVQDSNYMTPFPCICEIVPTNLQQISSL